MGKKKDKKQNSEGEMHMENKYNTNKLMEKLLAEGDFSRFLKLNDKKFINVTLKEYINSLLQKKALKPVDIIKKSNIERSYLYQIINGRRLPSRDKIIQLAIAIELNIDETQRFLKVGNKALLYPKVKRDAAIIFCIKNNYDLVKIQEFLHALNMLPLGDQYGK